MAKVYYYWLKCIDAQGKIKYGGGKCELLRIGAFDDIDLCTGEISPLMLKELNLELVMIGHSERRHVFGETDFEENKKVHPVPSWAISSPVPSSSRPPRKLPLSGSL